MRHPQRGFTLVEVMVVVAIVGILAAIAYPAYQDYTVRAKIAEVMTRGSEARLGVIHYYASRGYLPTTGLTDVFNTAGAGKVSQVRWSQTDPSNGVIVITINTDSASEGITQLGGNNVLTFTTSTTSASGALVWTCGGAGTTVAQKFRPASCK